MSDVTKEKEYAMERHLMVKHQIEFRGVKDKTLLSILEKIPRHLFVLPEYLPYAYSDQALPSICGQTISQPYIVAKMTELLKLEKCDKVLEIGTGTGYQTAVLAELAGEVYTMEIVEELYETAKKHTYMQQYKNVHFTLGDGYQGHKEAAPYDAIIVTAAPSSFPEELVQQLAPGGRMVVPVGDYIQTLYLVIKNPDNEIKVVPIIAVQFVPMVRKRDKK